MAQRQYRHSCTSSTQRGVGAPEKNQIGGVNEEVMVGVQGLTVKDASAEKQVVMMKNNDVTMEEITTDPNSWPTSPPVSLSINSNYYKSYSLNGNIIGHSSHSTPKRTAEIV
jgi:hypothetical protein